MSILMLIPSPLLGILLMESKMPLQYPVLVAYTVLFLAAVNFITVVLIEPYRRREGKLTLSALLAAIAVILLYAVSETVNRFVEHLGYEWLTPLVAAGVLLLYAAIFREKSVALKFQLSVNSIALAILWMAGSADKITMPF